VKETLGGGILYTVTKQMPWSIFTMH